MKHWRIVSKRQFSPKWWTNWWNTKERGEEAGILLIRRVWGREFIFVEDVQYAWCCVLHLIFTIRLWVRYFVSLLQIGNQRQNGCISCLWWQWTLEGLTMFIKDLHLSDSPIIRTKHTCTHSAFPKMVGMVLKCIFDREDRYWIPIVLGCSEMHSFWVKLTLDTTDRGQEFLSVSKPWLWPKWQAWKSTGWRSFYRLALPTKMKKGKLREFAGTWELEAVWRRFWTPPMPHRHRHTISNSFEEKRKMTISP